MNGGVERTEPKGYTVVEGPAETNGEYLRLEAVMYPPPGPARESVELPHEPWGLDNGQEHVHPKQEEWFEVTAGKLRVAYDGTERTLTEGESVTLPRDVPHTHWNPTREPTRFRWERRPARRSKQWLETNYVLAQQGRTDEDGVPESLLQLSVWMNEHPHDTYATIAPVPLLRGVFAVLAPLGRLAGYDAVHTAEELGDGAQDGGP